MAHIKLIKLKHTQHANIHYNVKKVYIKHSN